MNFLNEMQRISAVCHPLATEGQAWSMKVRNICHHLQLMPSKATLVFTFVNNESVSQLSNICHVSTFLVCTVVLYRGYRPRTKHLINTHSEDSTRPPVVISVNLFEPRLPVSIISCTHPALHKPICTSGFVNPKALLVQYAHRQH